MMRDAMANMKLFVYINSDTSLKQSKLLYNIYTLVFSTLTTISTLMSICTL
uniref:Uncharacterized protein n=1 Tax=Octopus bimaculoides TaxID=37653 RepID=A0A0L8G0E0_OCTBM